MSTIKSILSMSRAVVGVLLASSGAAYADAVWLPHNKVEPFAPDNAPYQRMFVPVLSIIQACHSFPAVDRYGRLNNGLNPSGSMTGGCNHSVGQVYVRAKWFNGECAVMYSWYFPKDQVVDKHRHDWENAVVWLSECSTRARVNAVSYSQHGGYKKLTNPPMSGTNPMVLYTTNWIMNHALEPGVRRGGTQPLIRWFGMPWIARYYLTHTSFGKAHVPMIDQNFDDNIARAWYR